MKAGPLSHAAGLLPQIMRDRVHTVADLKGSTHASELLVGVGSGWGGRIMGISGEEL